MKLKFFLRNLKDNFFELIERFPFILPFFVFIWFSILKIEPLILSLRFGKRIFRINAQYITRDNQVCHIFGNGMSVMESYKNVRESDFVIKINSGVLIPVHTNIWMTELPGKSELTGKDIRSNVKLFSSLTEIVKGGSPNVVLLIKNIWPENVSPDLYDTKHEFFILLDFLLRPLPKEFLDVSFFRLRKFIIKTLILDHGNIIGQMYTSLLTALILSYRLGFKEIVIHGLDGCGAHFFHDSYFDHVTDDIRVDAINALRNAFPKQPSEVVYSPGSDARIIINDYIQILDSFGVKVSFAN